MKFTFIYRSDRKPNIKNHRLGRSEEFTIEPLSESAQDTSKISRRNSLWKYMGGFLKRMK